MILSKTFSGTVIKGLLKDVLPIVEKYAPTVASFIGGPAGILTSAAIGLLNAEFPSNGGAPGLATSILNDPDAQVKLTKMESDHAEWLQKLAAGVMDEVNALTSAEINIKLNWAVKDDAA